MARLLEFPMPTMCIFNGTAIAGGYILGLCHDYRTMNAKVGNICLSELKLGTPLPMPYMKVCAAKLTPNVCAKAAYGVTFDQQEALKDGLIDATFESGEDLAKQIGAFVKRYGAVSIHRDAIKVNKQTQMRHAIDVCRTWTFDPIADKYYMQRHAFVTKILQAQAAAATKKRAAQAKPKL